MTDQNQMETPRDPVNANSASLRPPSSHHWLSNDVVTTANHVTDTYQRSITLVNNNSDVVDSSSHFPVSSSSFATNVLQSFMPTIQYHNHHQHHENHNHRMIDGGTTAVVVIKPAAGNKGVSVDGEECRPSSLTSSQLHSRHQQQQHRLSKERINELERRLHRLERKLVRGSFSSISCQNVERNCGQYVPMQRYRFLKSKAKKLLSSKCEALRAETLAKESLQTQIDLQNKELSELRQLFYKNENKSSDDSENRKLKDNLLQTLKSCSFATSCLLGVCRDFSTKKFPDYDQLLGLKSVDGMTLSFLLDKLPVDSCCDVDRQFLENASSFAQKNHDLLREMQRRMLEYYTNELVDSIHCQLH